MSNPVIICSLSDGLKHLNELALKAGFNLETSRLILVKPNICGLYHPSSDLLSSIVEYLSTHARSIVIGETRSMVHDPETQFDRLGVNALIKRFSSDVKAVDLSDDDWVKVKVPNPHALKELDLPRTVLDADILVNLPKVGTHSMTRLTCALKNLFGLLPQKSKHSVYHHLDMDKVIADIAQVTRPDLNIVDAENKLILGIDALAVDVVACRFVNLDPLKIEHLRLVSQDRGEKLEEFMRKLKTDIIEI